MVLWGSQESQGDFCEYLTPDTAHKTRRNAPPSPWRGECRGRSPAVLYRSVVYFDRVERLYSTLIVATALLALPPVVFGQFRFGS